jgi:hypothetical protein
MWVGWGAVGLDTLKSFVLLLHFTLTLQSILNSQKVTVVTFDMQPVSRACYILVLPIAGNITYCFTYIANSRKKY